MRKLSSSILFLILTFTKIRRFEPCIVALPVMEVTRRGMICAKVYSPSFGITCTFGQAFANPGKKTKIFAYLCPSGDKDVTYLSARKERTKLERILSRDAHIIPCRGVLRVCAMFLPDLWKSRCSLADIEGFDHSVANTFLGACGNLPSPQESPMLPYFVWQCGETKELSERLTLMEFDFSKPMSSCSGEVEVDFTETGICHGFILWIDWVLNTENGIIVSTGPDCRQWKQGVKLLKTPMAVGIRDHKCLDEHHSVKLEANLDSENGDLMIQYDFVK